MTHLIFMRNNDKKYSVNFVGGAPMAASVPWNMLSNKFIENH